MRPAWAIVALVVAAAIRLVVALAPDAYSIVGPYFLLDGPMALRALDAIVPFGLAAAVLVGADRWDEGRSHLWWGAAALAVAGVAQLASDAILAAWTASGNLLPDLLEWVLPALFVAGSGAMAIAAGLLAAGLWRAGRARGAPAGLSSVLRGLRIGIAVAGAACVVATAWTAFASTGTPAEFLVIALVGVVCVAAGIAALAALAIIALWSRPPSGELPELLIAVGSVAVVIGLTAQWVLPYAVSHESPAWVEAAFAVVGWSRIAGFAALAAGFLTAAGTHVTRVEADAQ